MGGIMTKKQHSKFEIEMKKQKAHKKQHQKINEETRRMYSHLLTSLLFDCMEYGSNVISISTFVDHDNDGEYFRFSTLMESPNVHYALPVKYDDNPECYTTMEKIKNVRRTANKKRQEQTRVAQIKAEALAKLTKEELDVLGL